MDVLKKIPGVSTPQAPKFRPLALPALGEGEVPPVPLLVEQWSSSDSGSSVSSSSPSTPASSPAVSPAPWRSSRTMTPYHRAPSVRSPTPQCDLHGTAWHVMSADVDKQLHMSRQALTPSPEMLKQPRARRASAAHQPSPVQIMQGLVSPQPSLGKPLKSILKHTSPPSAASSPAPPTPLRMSEVSLHWQLIPYQSYWAHRRTWVHFDVSKPVELIVIRDFSTSPPRKLSDAETKRYLTRPVCERQQLRQMTVRYDRFPQWVVHVARPDGDVLCVRDVFQALADDMNKVLSRGDRSKYIPKDTIDAHAETFKKRCEKSTRATPESERSGGMRRVDMLLGENVFQGLTRPEKEDQDYWIAHFGAKTPQ